MQQGENSSDEESAQPKKLKSESEPNPLYALLSSNDPTKHQLALSMIQEGANLDGPDTEGNTLLQVAVKSEASDVIQALLKKTNYLRFQWKEYRDSFKLAMRSPNAAKLLKLFFQHCYLEFAECCKYLPWDMSRDHLVSVLRTIMQLTNRKREIVVGNLLREYEPKNFHLLKLLISRRNTNEKLQMNFQSLLSNKLILSNAEVVAFLVWEGADVNVCVTIKGEYPLHLAFKCNRGISVPLLLQVGADVNITDQLGETPFSTFVSTGQTGFYLLELTKLMIKRFVCLFAEGKRVSEKNLSTVRRHSVLQGFYSSCIEELNRMKTVEAADGFSYYWLLSKTSYELSLLMRNMETCNQVKKGLLPLEIFPIFKTEMISKLGVARRMRDTLVAREREIEEVFGELFPCLVVRKIARCTLDPKNFEKEYYLKQKLF